jgi:hypothetical protein
LFFNWWAFSTLQGTLLIRRQVFVQNAANALNPGANFIFQAYRDFGVFNTDLVRGTENSFRMAEVNAVRPQLSKSAAFSIPDMAIGRHPFAALHMSAFGRFCCRSLLQAGWLSDSAAVM